MYLSQLRWSFIFAVPKNNFHTLLATCYKIHYYKIRLNAYKLKPIGLEVMGPLLCMEALYGVAGFLLNL